MKRPILVAIVGYIIGILWGLYLKINIVPFYFIIVAIYFLSKKIFNHKNKFKLISIKRYLRYVKLIITNKVVLVIAIFSIISNIIINLQENDYQNIYLNEGNVSNILCIVEGNKEQKEYYDKYKIKVVKYDAMPEFEQKHFYIKLKKKSLKNIEYGDLIQISGEYVKPEMQRNYGGFYYQNYLKTKKIYGIINVSNIEILDSRRANFFMMISNDVFLNIKNNIERVFEKDIAGILKALLLGDNSNIEEDIEENFKNASISHILAISGMHISYIIIGISKLFNKRIGKKSTKIVVIIFLIIYMFITGFSPSIIRATIMGILVIISSLVYRKNDIWTSISISLFIILIYNPYLIMNVGLQLSYLGTIGIIVFNKWIFQILDSIHLKKKKYKKKIQLETNKKHIIAEKTREILSVSIAAQITILPIIIYHFNTLNPYFILSNFLISIIIGPIIILGFIFIISSFISVLLSSFVSRFLKIGLQILIFISNIGNLPYSKIYVATPNILYIAIYVVLTIIIKHIYFVYSSKQINITRQRIKNLIELFKYKFRLNRKKVIKLIVAIIIIFLVFIQIPKNLKIFFVDVGQGDCTLIVTPGNKTILIDGGGSEFGSFDVGKSVLIPYILDRGFTKIDYIIVSHFDSDHVGGLLTVMEELKVDTVLISKQGELSQNYEKFKQLVKEKHIKVLVVGQGDVLKIEKDLYFNILWPNNTKLISENVLNNNSIVCKMHYKSFSCIFTGDIEEIAEKQILQEYKNNLQILNSTILKVGHHGSKTSTSLDFLKAVSPKIALIGVGQNNNFGHPNDQILERLQSNGVKVFRTDEDGEISIVVNRKGRIKIKNCCYDLQH